MTRVWLFALVILAALLSLVDAQGYKFTNTTEIQGIRDLINGFPSLKNPPFNWDAAQIENVCYWYAVNCTGSYTNIATIGPPGNQFTSFRLDSILGPGYLSNSIGDFSYLTSLQVYTTKFTKSIPDTISKLSRRLEELILVQLPNGNITDVPPTTTSQSCPDVNSLINLRQLKLWAFDCSKTDFSGMAYMRNLMWLSLDGCNLKTMPLSITNLNRSLYWMSLRGNDLNELPEEIGNLATLVVVNVDYNNLQQLPDGLKDIPLYELYASFNQLTSVPDLRSSCLFYKLNVSHNRLTEFPTFLSDPRPATSTPFQTIDLSYNQITGTLPTLTLTNSTYNNMYGRLKNLILDHNNLEGDMEEATIQIIDLNTTCSASFNSPNFVCPSTYHCCANYQAGAQSTTLATTSSRSSSTASSTSRTATTTTGSGSSPSSTTSSSSSSTSSVSRLENSVIFVALMIVFSL